MLETTRCYLRLFKTKDIDQAIGLFISNDVRKYLGGAISENEARLKLNNYANNSNGVYFSVFLKNNDVFIGSFSISTHHNGVNKEISYQVLPQFWGNGYATEVLLEVLKYCRNVLELKYIVSETQSKNYKSCALLDRVGYELKEKVVRFGEEQSIYQFLF